MNYLAIYAIVIVLVVAVIVLALRGGKSTDSDKPDE